MYHAQHGLFFGREKDGSVQIEKGESAKKELPLISLSICSMQFLTHHPDLLWEKQFLNEGMFRTHESVWKR